MEQVDSGKLKFVPAADFISHLSEKEQTYLLMVMDRDEVSPSVGQAKRLKELSAEGKLENNIIDLIMREKKLEPGDPLCKIGVNEKRLKLQESDAEHLSKDEIDALCAQIDIEEQEGEDSKTRVLKLAPAGDLNARVAFLLCELMGRPEMLGIREEEKSNGKTIYHTVAEKPVYNYYSII